MTFSYSDFLLGQWRFRTLDHRQRTAATFCDRWYDIYAGPGHLRRTHEEYDDEHL